MFEWLESGLASLGGEGFGAATVATMDDQEALGQSIVDRAIFDQSVLDLNAANEHAALGFEGAYQHATLGPDYDPTQEDPYGFQQILGRAIVQQAQGAEAVKDDSPLNRVNAADLGAWVNSALGAAKDFVTPSSGPTPISGAPRSIFSNRPGQGSGWNLFPSRSGSAVSSGSGPDAQTLLLLGVLAVGAYYALK